MRWTTPLVAVCLATGGCDPLQWGFPRVADPQTLVGFASLPADTFAAGPTSGQFITAANGVKSPFVNRQPVQGFSSVLRSSNGDFLVMPDNGFGSKATSVDFVLRVYRISPDFKRKTGGTGAIRITSYVTLHDPDRRINFPIVADRDVYPGTPNGIAVDGAIREQRLVTGGDLDIESFREASDGTFWFGDEFGPFLVHTDANGKILEAPIPLPGVQSPQNPFGGAANLAASRGFEGIALPPGGKQIYAMLEGPIAGADPQNLVIHEFDLERRRYTGRQWTYRLNVPGYAVGDFTAVTDRLFLAVQRDDIARGCRAVHPDLSRQPQQARSVGCARQASGGGLAESGRSGSPRRHDDEDFSYRFKRSKASFRSVRTSLALSTATALRSARDARPIDRTRTSSSSFSSTARSTSWPEQTLKRFREACSRLQAENAAARLTVCSAEGARACG